MSNEIIYTNLAAKPTRPTRPTPAPTPKAPAETPAPQVKRIRIGWGEEGRKGVAAQSAEQANASAKDTEQPQRSLVKVRRTVSSDSRSFSKTPPRIEMGRVERSSKLERIRGQRLLYETLAERTEQSALEHLTILHNQSAERYWIADAETGEIVLRQSFATLQHCHAAAAELEQTFHMAEVLMLRPSDTMERIGELVQQHWLRERVAVVCHHNHAVTY